MRRSLFIIMTVFASTVLSAQYKAAPNRPYTVLGSNPGYLIIIELTGGIGLGGKTAPFSSYYFGFTSVTGYQVNKNFFFGAGTGLSFYESGLLVPLFIDFRLSFNVGSITPYL